jgi:hypothetical protein
MSVHRAPNAEKGARYLGLLDKALCDANWSEVPEWARKVEKHAPERKSMLLEPGWQTCPCIDRD